MSLTADPAASSPSPAVRAARRRVERAEALDRLRPPDVPGPTPRARTAVGGRGTHVVDRALAYRRYAEGGMSAAAIARRVRKSKSHVSILLRLGAALDGLEPGELAAFRTPAVTWRLVQRLVRGDTRVQSAGERQVAVLALRRALRDTIGGFSSYTVDRRRHRKGRTPGAPALERFDPGAFAADPAGYVAAHVERLVAAHEALARQALRVLDGALAAERLAAVPLSALARLSRPQLAAIAAQGREHLTPAQQRAVDALDAASRLLADLVGVAAAARAGATRPATVPRAPPSSPRARFQTDAGGVARRDGAASDITTDDITADDIADDLAD